MVVHSPLKPPFDVVFKFKGDLGRPKRRGTLSFAWGGGTPRGESFFSGPCFFWVEEKCLFCKYFTFYFFLIRLFCVPGGPPGQDLIKKNSQIFNKFGVTMAPENPKPLTEIPPVFFPQRGVTYYPLLAPPNPFWPAAPGGFPHPGFMSFWGFRFPENRFFCFGAAAGSQRGFSFLGFGF